MKRIMIFLTLAVFPYVFGNCGDINASAILTVNPSSVDITISSTEDIMLHFVMEVRDPETDKPMGDYRVHFSTPVAYGDGCMSDRNKALGEFRRYPNSLTVNCPGYVTTNDNGIAEVYFVFYPYILIDDVNFSIGFWLEGNMGNTYQEVDVTLAPPQ